MACDTCGQWAGGCRCVEREVERTRPASELRATPFWESVGELASMRDKVPEERRSGSGARAAIESDAPSPTTVRPPLASAFFELDDVRSGCHVRVRKSSVDEVIVSDGLVTVITALGNVYSAEFIVEVAAREFAEAITAPQESVTA